MPSLQEKLVALEREPWYQKAPPEEQAAIRLKLNAKLSGQGPSRAQELQGKFESIAKMRASGASDADIARARSEALRSTIEARQEAQNAQTNPIARGFTKVASPLVAAGAAYADMGTFGNAANFASLIGSAGELSRGGAKEAGIARLGAAKEMHPIASTVGSLAGAFVKTPFSAVTRFGGRLVGEPVSRLTAAAAERFFQSGLATYAAKLSGQIGANVLGSGMSIGAMNLLTDLGNGPGVGGRIQKTIKDTLSPTNLAISAVVGGVQAGLRVKPIPERVALLKRLEREMPGFKATPDMYRDDGVLTAAIAQAQHLGVPGVSGTASRIARESVVKPLQESVNGLRAIGGKGVNATERVEKPLRAALGTPQVAGSLKRAVMGQQGAARAAENATAVPRDTLLGFLRAAVQFGKDEGRGSAGRSSQLGGIIADVRNEFARQMRAVRTGRTPRVPYDAKALLNIRSRLDEVINWESLAKQGKIATSVFSERDVREAKALRDVIGTFVGASLPQIDAANRAQATVSRVLDAFSTPATVKALGNAPDGTLLKQVFSPSTFFTRVIGGKKILGRWEAFGGAVNQDAKQMAAASYAKMYIDEMGAGAADRALPSVWSPLLSQVNKHDGSTTSMFGRQIADTVVPGLRDWVRDRAQMMELFRKGMGSAIGSQTEPRTAMLVGLGAAASAPYAMYELFSDHKDSKVRAILGVLGTVGTAALARSALGGSAANQLNRLATGAGVVGPTTTSAALAGNNSPLMNAGEKILGVAPSAATNAASALVKLGQSRPETGGQQ